jgi:hypothetical protein
MTRVLAIDAGSTHTAFVVWDGLVAHAKGFMPNCEFLSLLKSGDLSPYDEIAFEMIACYGMPVGKEVFDTCVWIGRFSERCKGPQRMIYRKEVKMYLCGTMRAKDANVRQALIDRIGAIGTKKQQGPLYGFKSHLWAALAVAEYAINNS